MKNPHDIGARVDAKAEELLAEFDEHCAEVQAKDPTCDNRHELFLCWCMQKLAGLHVVVLDHEEQLNESASKRSK